MKEDIYNKKINITNIEDFEFVCYTISRILVYALAAFGYKGEIKKDTNKDLSHVYVVVEHNLSKREIFKDETLDLLNKYENPLCQHLVVETAKKLPICKQNGILF